MSDEKRLTGEVWLDIGMGWCLRYETSDYWLDFKAYEVIGTSLDGTVKEFWEDPDKLSASPMNTDPAKCKPTHEGFVKWDGCMEIELGQPHFCGAEDVAEFGEVLKGIHALALKIPHVDYDCAGYPDPAVPRQGEGG